MPASQLLQKGAASDRSHRTRRAGPAPRGHSTASRARCFIKSVCRARVATSTCAEAMVGQVTTALELQRCLVVAAAEAESPDADNSLDPLAPDRRSAVHLPFLFGGAAAGFRVHDPSPDTRGPARHSRPVPAATGCVPSPRFVVATSQGKQPEQPRPAPCLATLE